MPFLKSLRLDNFLSFPPGSEAVNLTRLNVLIGPNGSGKSNFIEGIDLLHATPTNNFANTIRTGGSATEWIWKGNPNVVATNATLEAIIHRQEISFLKTDLRYLLSFASSGGMRTEITDEIIEGSDMHGDSPVQTSFYRFQAGNPVINTRNREGQRKIKRQSLIPDESIFSQRKDPDLYPVLTWLGSQFAQIQTFREWTFGRTSLLRRPQGADLPISNLEPDSRNLALILNHIEHTDLGLELNRYLSYFLPRYKHLSTKTYGNTIQFFIHEDGLSSPIPVTRLSDGTIRFIAILALLLSPNPPPLICIEEPELGLHPDAVSMLSRLLIETSSRTQLIVTTHSDALVSALTEEAESVLVCEHLNGTVMRRVESEKLRYWLDRYRLGEIWRLGELGGNP